MRKSKQNIKLLSAFLRYLRRLMPAATIALVFAITIPSAPPAIAATTKWEFPKTERSDARTVAKDSEIEIKAAKGIVIVNSSRPVQIKIYTILGQLISKENLPAGISQLSIQAHGVYIIKTGDLTCKVAL